MEAMEDDKKCCTPDDANSEGTSRLTRFLQMLDPANAPVDARNSQDILVFAKRYAELVRFYDFDDTVDCVEEEELKPTTQNLNPPVEEHKKEQHSAVAELQKLEEKNRSGANKNIVNWKEFFYNDIAVVVASVSQYENKLWHIKDEYNAIRKEAVANPTKENLRKVFLSIIHHLKRIQRWYDRSVDSHPLKNELEIKIKSFLVPSLKKLMAYDKGMLVNVQDDMDLITQYESFKDAPWFSDYNKIELDATIYVGDSVNKKIIYALMYVDDVFNTMFKVYEEITKRSGFYWQQAVENFPSHQPHMALFISFVELFSYAKNELNNLTRRHLEFFYRDVLHLKERPANPDSVYLIYQLAKGVEDFDLKQGTELTAGKDAIGKQLIYQTSKELVINTAKVRELKTVFVDKVNPIINIYAAPVANSADGKGEKFKDTETAWSTFGYFEPRDDISKMTGEKAQFGFAFATPQLNLSQSERTIDIKISFENKKKNAAGNDEKIKLTSQDFEIYFTGEKEWIQPMIETEMEDFKIGTQTKPVAVPVVFRNRLLNFLNSPDLDPAKIAPGEHRLGPIFDDASFGPGDGWDDNDLQETAGLLLDRRNNLMDKEFADLSQLYIKGKIGPDKIHDLIYSFSNQVAVSDNKDHILFFRTRIQSKQKDITVPGKDFKDFSFKTQDPVCKIVFKQDSQVYELLKDVVINKVEVNVNVTGLTDIVGLNDDGPFPIDKPVDIITSFPRIGSAFSFGSPEFKNKKLTNLKIRGEWIGDIDFATRYVGYGLNRTDPKVFTCSYELFYNNKWNAVSGPQQLFNAADPRKLELLIDTGTTPVRSESIEDNHYQIVRFVLNSPDFGHEEYPTLIASQLANRLDSQGVPVPYPIPSNGGQPQIPGKPVPTDPAPTEPPKDMAAERTVKRKAGGPEAVAVQQDAAPAGTALIAIAKPPYTPRLKSIAIDYASSQSLTSGNSTFFHIYPFGQTEIFYDPGKDFSVVFDDTTFNKLLDKEQSTSQLIVPTTCLLPQFKFGRDADRLRKMKQMNDDVKSGHKEFTTKNYFQFNQYNSLEQQQGNLYIGIENLDPPQNLSLLFKFADGTAYDNDNEPPKINWSYLANNEWLILPQDHLISDGTFGFQATGIVLIDFPADATNNNLLLTTGLHWLCASIDSNADRIPKLIDVIAQAGEATFYDQQNDPLHYKDPLPENRISRPLVKIPEVKVIEQPFESFNGKLREEGNQFYQRVSERLRHKNRAISAWDYEHLVLEQFPSIYKVKILTHTDPACLCRYQLEATLHINDCCCAQVAPGHVLVIPISNLRNKNAIDPLKPRTERMTLLRIVEFLKKRVSPFVHIDAKNPKFEEVKVSCSVKFYTGIDKGFYKRKLNDDLIHYLTPWAYDSNFEILFGNKIYASKIINFIEELDYVDYITCFRMIHILEGCCGDDSLADLDCGEMQTDLGNLKLYLKKEKDGGVLTDAEIQDRQNLQKIQDRIMYEVSATSSQAILVSAKQHCIQLIEEEPVDTNCNCAKPIAKSILKKPTK